MRGLLFAALALICTFPADATEVYPQRPVRIIVPYTAGGSADVLARLVAERLREFFKQAFVVENRSGAGGIIAHDAAAKAAPDGYTLLFSAAGPLVISPHTKAKLPYDPLGAFIPIKLVASSPLVLVVRPSLKYSTPNELVSESKKLPNGLSYGSYGVGSIAHVAAEMFKASSGAKIEHVPYRGGSQAITDMLGGNIDLIFDVIANSLPHLEAGALKALAVTSIDRSEFLPDVPTMTEAGFPAFEAATWFGLLAPAGTDSRIISALEKVVDEFLSDKAFQLALAKQAMVVGGGTSEEFGALLRSEFEKWGKVADSAGLRSN